MDRPEILKPLKWPGSGDLSEMLNTMRRKERQSFIEGRIGELSYKIGNAKVIDPATVTKDGSVCQSCPCGKSGY